MMSRVNLKKLFVTYNNNNNNNIIIITINNIINIITIITNIDTVPFFLQTNKNLDQNLFRPHRLKHYEV